MRGDSLARQYGVLTPWERVPLMAAAAARGDEAEVERLALAAPTASYRVPDHWGLSTALERLAYQALLARLDLVALYREATAWLAAVPPRPRRGRGKGRDAEARLGELARWFAYSFVVHADAWRLLCDELKLDPEALVRDQPGYGTVRRFEATARAAAFTAEEALDYLRGLTEEREGAAPEGITRVWRLDGAEDLARAWRECLDEWAGWWA